MLHYCCCFHSALFTLAVALNNALQLILYAKFSVILTRPVAFWHVLTIRVARVIVWGGAKCERRRREPSKGGPGGMLPREFWNLEYRKCDFLHFAGEILQKKTLLLRITHSHRPPLNFSSDFIFSQGWSFSSVGGWVPPCSPLSTPLVLSLKIRFSSEVCLFCPW